MHFERIEDATREKINITITDSQAIAKQKGGKKRKSDTHQDEKAVFNPIKPSEKEQAEKALFGKCLSSSAAKKKKVRYLLA